MFQEDEYTKAALEMSVAGMPPEDVTVVTPDASIPPVYHRPPGALIVGPGSSAYAADPPSYTPPRGHVFKPRDVSTLDRPPDGVRALPGSDERSSWQPSSATTDAYVDYPLRQEPYGYPIGPYEESPPARGYQPAGPGAAGVGYGGKSYEKSYDNRLSDSSFIDPNAEPFVEKVERQY